MRPRQGLACLSRDEPRRNVRFYGARSFEVTGHNLSRRAARLVHVARSRGAQGAGSVIAGNPRPRREADRRLSGLSPNSLRARRWRRRSQHWSSATFERPEALRLFGVEALTDVGLLQPVLFIGETPNLGDKFFVFHVPDPSRSLRRILRWREVRSTPPRLCRRSVSGSGR